MELIYKDALLKELGITNEDCKNCAWGDGYGYCTRDSDFTDACDAICTAPVIEERKTGKWIKVHGYCTPGGDPVWACSECGKGIHVYGIEHGTYGADVSDGQWKACPNCSALMEGEQP